MEMHMCLSASMRVRMHRCLDWDVSGTRWQRVGLSLSEAYEALGVRPRTSTREIKAAYHRMALANHPDKLKQTGASAADAEEAALVFMKAQKAFERIMETRRPKSAGAPPASPPPTAAPTKPAAARARSARASAQSAQQRSGERSGARGGARSTSGGATRSTSSGATRSSARSSTRHDARRSSPR